MFGTPRVRAFFVAAVVVAIVTPTAAYGLAPTTTTTTTVVGGPPITPEPGSTTTTIPGSGSTPSTGPTTTTTIPPPPPEMPAFTLPTDSGLQLLNTMHLAQASLKTAQTGLAGAAKGVAAAKKKNVAAKRTLKKLNDASRATQTHLDETRKLLHEAAAEAYIHAGDTQLMTAIAGYLNTNSVVEAGSQLHVLGTVGSNQTDLLNKYLALEQRVTGELAEITDVSERATNTLVAAKKHLADVHATINSARTTIAVSLAGIHDFETAATSATSPILGPSRLTARQMADYLIAQHANPRITVPIEVLAQEYLDEGARTGVRGDVAFAQSILETGGFANPGSAPTDNNFAGIGWCDSCKHGFDFATADLGVRAQLQLLRIYVDPKFPEADYKDKILLPGTLKLGFRGKVQTWWDLWGTWATGALYGQRVYDIYERMVAFAQLDPEPAKVPATPGAPAAGKPATNKP